MKFLKRKEDHNPVAVQKGTHMADLANQLEACNYLE